MAPLPAKAIFALAAILAAVLSSSPLLADPSSSSTASTSRRFEYGPYGSQNNSGSGGQAIPQDNAVAPAVGPPADNRSEGPAYRDDGRGNAQPSADDNDDGADGPPPDANGPPGNGDEPSPRDTAGPPPGEFDHELPRVEVRASAPDSNVPYEIREHDARRAAVEAWRSKVANRFGPAVAHWRTAAEKHVDCMPDAREGLVCIASGLPVRGFDRDGRWRREGHY